jgi:hypothetical protein
VLSLILLLAASLLSGEVCSAPEFALFCVANAAVHGVVVALQAEMRGRPQRVNEARTNSCCCCHRRAARVQLPIASWLRPPLLAAEGPWHAVHAATAGFAVVRLH